MERFQVRLKELPGNEIAFLKALRLVGGVSLSDAAKVYLHACRSKRTVLFAGVDEAVARHIAAAFDDFGTPTEVEPSSVRSPMICRPEANRPFVWGSARTRVAVVEDA